ncbi:hypothetical protein A8W25_05215 [Streptomyces sp. ERV7]|uniref:hypothetical protein n=1 Tax=Streptomyces sp. ERV7 TaxID=1322334 RepID=UPI0007F395A2|nr:hypothetical protein [Streptomyces sp. ERV7]OAR27618.1 hypothetical protein A8W25_05215 [Streptomyces sp. ERV7]
MTDPSAVPPRPRPSDSTPDGIGLLRGRMLIQTRPTLVKRVSEQIAPSLSGLLLCGDTAARTAQRMRRNEGYSGVLLADPACYESTPATEEAPFPENEPDGFFMNDPLEVSLSRQRAAGVTVPISPTGYIQAEDSDALRAAARRMVELGDPSVIFSVPIDVAWLRNEESTKQLISFLQLVPGPKAIMLGGQMDPLSRYAKAVTHLRLLITEVSDAALVRADLAAFGALAAGALFTAFGGSSGLRHIVAPGEKAQTSRKGGGGPTAPHVLHPELMDFYLGDNLADKYGGGPAPICECYACEGRALDIFTSNHAPLPAQATAHNIAVLMSWLRDLRAIPAGIERERWWHNRCLTAVDQYPLVNATLRQPGAFKVPEQLNRWALAAPEATPAAAEAPCIQRTR